MILDLDAFTFFIVMAIFLLGGVIKGILGFGLPLITMSLLPFVVPVEKSIVISALVQPLTNLGQLITSGGIRRAAESVMPVLLGLPAGVIVGTWFLASLESENLLAILGCTVLAFSLYNLTGFSIRITDTYRQITGGILGFAGGVIGILTSINGPVFIMYLLGIGADRQNFRSAIALLFVVSALLISSGFWSVGLLDKPTVLLGMYCLLPAFAGMWLGNLVGKKIPAEVFRRIVLAILAVIGSSFLFKSTL